MQVCFTITGIDAGWATLRIRFAAGSKSRTVVIECSFLGGDSIGDLVRGFVRLSGNDAKRVEVDFDCEPANFLVSLRRRGAELIIVMKHYTWDGDGAPAGMFERALTTGKEKDWKKLGKSRRSRKAFLRERVSFLEAMGSLVNAFEEVKERVGEENYGFSWRFPYPSSDLDRLKSILADNASNDGR